MESKINKSSVIAMAGIGLSLLSLVVIFSQGTPLDFLCVAVIAPFGFIGFWILLPFLFITGLYMLLQQKLMKFRVGLSLWGLFIIIFSLLILATTWVEQELIPGGDLNFGNISPTYTNALNNLGYNPYDTKSGGGFIGYFLTACLYSAITKIGAQIVCWVLIFIGLLLVLNRQIKRLFLIRKNHKENIKPVIKDEIYLEKDGLEEVPLIEEEPFENINESLIQEKTVEAPVNNDFVDNSPISAVPASSFGIRKAQFSLSGDDDYSFNEVSNNSTFSEPVFGQDDFVKPSYEEPSVPQKEDINETTNIEDEIDINDIKEDIEFTEPDLVLEKPSIQPEIIKPVIKQEPLNIEKPVEEEIDKLHRPQPKANPIKNYIYPPIDLLDYHEDASDSEKNAASTQDTINRINEVFNNLHIGAQVVGSTVGPCVTRYDVQTNSDVSVSQVAKYVEDISIRLGGVPTRFEKIVYGKATSGLEIPNAVRTNVGLRESIAKLEDGPKHLLDIPFGKNIAGELLSANLADFPHMLVSGTTGSGKTIFMHSVILSLIMRNKPDELKLILIDPKKVEMNYYEKIPHLLCPNISQSQKAFVAMKKLVDEMERRYNLFAANRVRDIKGFNQFAHANNLQPLPYIVVFIDEYADLVEEVKDIKQPVVRIAQKARAAGIHLVIATQRPSVNVIDGVIKANVAVRVALMVASQVDSISIINQAGAESLLGNGDMIIECPLINRSLKPRVQGCFVDVPEINRVCDFLRSHYSESYDPEFLDLEEHDEVIEDDDSSVSVVDKDMAEESLYELIKGDIVKRDYCSISYIQRTYAVGFPKAGRLFNKLVNDGFVARAGDARGSKVLIHEAPQEQQMGTIEQSTFVPDSEDN